jgi:hypothetical protein
MMTMRLLVPLTAALLVAGCDKAADDDAGHSPNRSHGRYAGIGVVSKNALWNQLVQPKADQVDPAAATLDDDEHVMVVVDTNTGEIRQCGDVSGFCTSMNPWELGKQQPVKLVKHAIDLAREAEEEAKGEKH